MSWRSEREIGLREVTGEAVRIALSNPIPTTVVLLIVASVCGFIVATTGQTVRAEQAVLANIDDAGTRMVSAIDDQATAEIPPEAVDRLRRLSSVEWVIGLGFATDAMNSALGPAVATPVAVRDWWGDLEGVVAVEGRDPLPGEALVGPEAQVLLGLDLPIGAIDRGDAEVPVVGRFTPVPALASLDNTVLARPAAEPAADRTLRSVHVFATDPAQVAPLATAMAGLLGAGDSTSVRFETSEDLAAVRAAVEGELGEFGRQLVLVALGVGLVLVGLVVYGSTALRRQDFGRRRALGASRGVIMALVVIQSLFVSLAGAALGTAAGGVVVYRLTSELPDARFAAAVAVLTILSVVGASIPPAAVAAYRDPVRVLRVP